jgi:hypothetical protein
MMPALTNGRFVRVPDPPRPGLGAELGRFVDTGRQGLVRRFLVTHRHLLALAVGGLTAWLRELPREERRQPSILAWRAVAAVCGVFVDRGLRREPFPVQLRRRLEILGPTYIKLGQILSLREDLLPRSITAELGNLLDRLPAVPYDRFLDLVARNLGRPVHEVFAHIRSTPLASASIGQIHLATLLTGEQVILKAVKPGIRKTLQRDTRLLRLAYAMLYGPRAERTEALIKKHIRPLADEAAKGYHEIAGLAVDWERVRAAIGDKALQVSSDPFDHWPFNEDRAAVLESELRARMQRLPPNEFQDLLRPCFQEDEMKLILAGAVLGLIAGAAQIAFVF